MKAYNVPGISVAVIDNYQIVWAKGFGVIGAGSSAPVKTNTLYQAGSISKPVAATGALALVEAGKLSLDEDVNRKAENVESAGERVHQGPESHAAAADVAHRRAHRTWISGVRRRCADADA